jgi:hypothetical protein
MDDLGLLILTIAFVVVASLIAVIYVIDRAEAQPILPDEDERETVETRYRKAGGE